MYWNELNEENIERAKELYYDYLEQNKDKYSNQLKSFEEYLEDDVAKCDRCGELHDWNCLKLNESVNYSRLCQECYDDLFTNTDDWQDNYEENKLREEGLL